MVFKDAPYVAIVGAKVVSGSIAVSGVGSGTGL